MPGRKKRPAHEVLPFSFDAVEEFKRFIVVIVGIKYPGNLGAVARVMKNLGFTNLRLVKPRAGSDVEARMAALEAHDVLDAAQRFETLSEAVGDAGLVIGTTRWSGPARPNPLSPAEAAILLRDTAGKEKAAFVFGCEDKGLSREEIGLCDWIVTIPTGSKFSSINISHAAGIVLSGVLNAFMLKKEKSRADPETLEALFARASDLLGKAGFIGERDRPKMLAKLRRLLRRMDPGERDVRILHGIIGQLELAIKRGIADAKSGESII